MFKKTLTYTGHNGETVTEDHYFHLDKAELLEMEIGEGMSDKLATLSATKNGREIIDTFKFFIQQSYGRRIDNGRRFSKKPEYFEEFSETGAYSALFMELATDADAGAKFVSGLMPADMIKQVQEEAQSRGMTLDVPVEKPVAFNPATPGFSTDELQRMLQERQAQERAAEQGNAFGG